MRAVFRSLVLAGCLTAFFVVGGGHWAVLQTVAWAGMAVSYTQESGSLREGLTRTFDGEHPCELCRTVSAGVQKESRDERRSGSGNAELGKVKLTAVLLPMTPFVPFAPFGESLPTMARTDSGKPADSPPVPPPRLA